MFIKKPGYLNFFISKYGISLVQIHVGQLKIYKAWFGDIFQEAFHRDLSRTHSGLINHFCDSFGGYYIEFHILIAKNDFFENLLQKTDHSDIYLLSLKKPFALNYVGSCLRNWVYFRLPELMRGLSYRCLNSMITDAP